MHLPNCDFRPEHTAAPPAIVSEVSRGDVTWNRPVFKAPPLEIALPRVDPKQMVEELRRSVRFER